MHCNTLGPLFLDIASTQLADSEKHILASPHVGGVVLFSRNYADKKQLSTLILSIREANPNLLLCVDHEGGRVQRFREGFTRIPAMQKLGQYLVRQAFSSSALERVRDVGWLMASELLAMDIDLSFAPVLDVDENSSRVIGDRAFSGDPEQVIMSAQAFIEGMHEAGMGATAKHFPGHGRVIEDSHFELPVDDRDLEAIVATDMLPFSGLKDRLDGMMPAHITYPRIDAQPVGFSRVWLDFLRHTLGFQGVIFSDDLNMNGASCAGDCVARATIALDAGCDAILLCNNPEGARDVEAYLSRRGVPGSSRLTKMRGRKRVAWSDLERSQRWHDVRKWIDVL